MNKVIRGKRYNTETAKLVGRKTRISGKRKNSTRSEAANSS